MRELQPSRHIPRAHRIQFAGSPQSGLVEVRCPSETDFDLVRLSDGWVSVATGEGFRSVLPVPKQPSAYLAYIAAVSLLWKTPAPKGINETILHRQLKLKRSQ